MHEASLVESILFIAEENLKPYQIKQVNSIKVCIGRFAGVMEDALFAAFEAATQEGLFKGAKLQINKPLAQVRCYSCENLDEIDHFPYQCSSCGSKMAELLTGRELYLEAVDFDEVGD